jgi:UDP-glucose 4-epimerase
MSRVFITGGLGFIGSHIARKLLDLGHEVVVFDNFLRYADPSSSLGDYVGTRLNDVLNRLTVIRGSTLNHDFLRRAVIGAEPTHVIHMASMPLATLSSDRPEEAYESILTGTLNLLQVCRDLPKLQRFVLASSSMVYGDFVTEPATEEHPTSPKDVYGGLKLCSEVLTKTFSGVYKVPFTIIRPTAVYGPTDANKRVLSIFLDNAMKGLPIKVKGAEQRLDFTFVKDTAAGIVAATFHEKAVGEIFNIARGEAVSLLDAAKVVQSLVPGTKVIMEERDARFPSRGTLDITKARRLLGFAPEYTLERGMKEYFDFLKGSGTASPAPAPARVG